MGKFKVGDRVKSLSGGAEYVGVVGTIVVDDGSILPYKVELDRPVETYGDKTIWRSQNNLELFEQTAAWVPKVGDRVRWKELFKASMYTAGKVYDIHNAIGETLYVTDDNDNKSHTWSADAIADHFELVQPFKIEAGKFYKTRDGRKVGPLRDDWSDDTRYMYHVTKGALNYSLWDASGQHYLGSHSERDLVAEWVDEPVVAVAASNDNAGQTTLGDILQALVGRSVSLQVKRQNPAIVALIENGKPKPSALPYVHADEASASKEAARLAGKHKGKEFGVYVLTQMVKEEQTFTYQHEWQRLAVAGERIQAIKALRNLSGLTLKSSKDAVDHWLDVGEPYSRIAA